MSRRDMYGAFRAGRSIKYIASITGASTSLVRYWVKVIGKDEGRFLQHVVLGRLVRQKGFKHIPDCYQVHDYVFHQENKSWPAGCPSNCGWCKGWQANNSSHRAARLLAHIRGR